MIASSLQLKNKTIKYIYVQCDFFLIIGIYTYIPNL